MFGICNNKHQEQEYLGRLVGSRLLTKMYLSFRNFQPKAQFQPIHNLGGLLYQPTSILPSTFVPWYISIVNVVKKELFCRQKLDTISNLYEI